MIPSRPKVVEYQGMPAYGYLPCGVSVISMLRSAIDWHSTSFKMLLEVSMLAAPDVERRISRRCASRPRRNGAGLCMTGLLQEAATNSEVVCCGARSKWYV